MRAAASVTTPEQYLASLPADRRTALETIHAAIVRAAPELEPHIVSGMIGYGRYHYKYASGREGDSATVAVASQKNYISIYICAADQDGYLAENNRHKLGKVSVGKSCIRFKKLADLDLKATMHLVKKAAKLRLQPSGFTM